MMWAGRFIGKSSKNPDDVGRQFNGNSSKNPDDVGKSVHREE